MKPVTIETIRCVDIDTTGLEPLSQRVWLSKTQCGRRYAIVGVETHLVDVVIVQREDNPDIPDDHLAILELAEKPGKYDGSIRDRYCIRYVPYHQAPTTCGVFRVDKNSHAEIQIGGVKRKYFCFTNPVLKNADRVRDIIWWHANRYFSFLDPSDVQVAESDLLEYIRLCTHTITLAEANRAADRALYRCARERGFRKLTKREQERLGLTGQWHSEAVYAAAQTAYANGKYHASGTGDHTRHVARGER